jgi:hypothetical protein
MPFDKEHLMTRRVTALVAAALLGILVLAPAALASDHLFDAATAPGATERGFANPVAGNPSGMSGAAARPGTVPGEGNPGTGQDLGTPSVDLSLVPVRSGR